MYKELEKVKLTGIQDLGKGSPGAGEEDSDIEPKGTLGSPGRRTGT